jgi:hypothetical protein
MEQNVTGAAPADDRPVAAYPGFTAQVCALCDDQLAAHDVLPISPSGAVYAADGAWLPNNACGNDFSRPVRCRATEVTTTNKIVSGQPLE